MKMEFHIGLSNDIKALGEFYKEWTGKGYDVKFMVGDCHDVIAEEDGKIVGALQLRIISDPLFNRNWGLIENVYVTPSARRIGIASAIMNYAENQAKVFDCEFIKLTSRKDEGKALYRSLGYVEGSSFRKDLNG